MQTEREFLTEVLTDLAKIKTDVFHAADSLHAAGYPEVSHDLLAIYRAVAATYGRVNRLFVATPAARPHA